jgi:SPP1 gp7 family putative phage head morphogenesis protein
MVLRYLTVDRRTETKKQRAEFSASIRIEKEFSRHLRKIANMIGHKVEQFDPDDAAEMTELEHMLMQYAELIRPWARAVSRRMLVDVSRKDEREWNKVSKKMSESIRSELHARNPTGKMLRALHAEQVELITSLPLEAAKRVHDLTIKNLSGGGRSADIAKEIMRTGEVTKSRANLIARTEVARSSSLLVESRAKTIGSEGYIWRTSRDQDVRLSHKKMEGKFVRWDSPPTLTDGTTTHAGQIYNCRCYPEPVIPDNI